MTKTGLLDFTILAGLHITDNEFDEGRLSGTIGNKDNDYTRARLRE